jgi:phosphatidylserine/phosphatidylglycerophosphate/cardiolipin synthase-like enzyme
MMRAMSRRNFVFLAASLLSCTPAKLPERAPEIAPVMLSLVESEPSETTLDRPDIPNAPDVWLEMFNNAKYTIDIAEFYASEAEPQWLASSKLAPIIDALAKAHRRDVKVRFLLDEKLVPQYAITIQHLEKAGVEVRRINGAAIFGADGVHHAKYFIVDAYHSFIGSQNFDWRSLDQIQEMGVRLSSMDIARLLMEIFETDWALAGGAPSSTRIQKGTPMGNFPGIEADRVLLVASPKGWLPDEESWDLPRIIGMLDGAKQSIDVQVLKYKTVDRAGKQFMELDNALRRAATRGVKIRMLVSEWAMKDKAVHELATVAGIRVLKVPESSQGPIPFARVAHAKYMVVDGHAAWIGSSNWEGDYFTRSRNVGLILTDGQAPMRLAKFFEENWSSQYALPLPPESPSPAGKP